eukprot:PhF_6_TR21017/c0_g1_i1/m.30199
MNTVPLSQNVVVVDKPQSVTVGTPQPMGVIVLPAGVIATGLPPTTSAPTYYASYDGNTRVVLSMVNAGLAGFLFCLFLFNGSVYSLVVAVTAVISAVTCITLHYAYETEFIDGQGLLSLKYGAILTKACSQQVALVPYRDIRAVKFTKCAPQPFKGGCFQPWIAVWIDVNVQGIVQSYLVGESSGPSAEAVKGQWVQILQPRAPQAQFLDFMDLPRYCF